MPNDEIENIIEKGVGELYRGLFQLRQSQQYQREYHTLGTIISMLTADRNYLIEVYNVNV